MQTEAYMQTYIHTYVYLDRQTQAMTDRHIEGETERGEKEEKESEGDR